MRVFDLDKTETLFDMRQHKAAVSSLQFRSKRHLYSASRDGHLCLYDAQQNFSVVAVVHVDANLPQHAWGPSGGDEHLTLATSPEHSVVACVTSRAPDRVCLFDAASLRKVTTHTRRERGSKVAPQAPGGFVLAEYDPLRGRGGRLRVSRVTCPRPR